jgi:hypothetical protein
MTVQLEPLFGTFIKFENVMKGCCHAELVSASDLFFAPIRPEHSGRKGEFLQLFRKFHDALCKQRSICFCLDFLLHFFCQEKKWKRFSFSTLPLSARLCIHLASQYAINLQVLQRYLSYLFFYWLCHD